MFVQETPKLGRGVFVHNLVLFGRVLRGLGLDVNPGRMMDWIRSIALTGVAREDDVYYAARALLVHEHADLASFDQAWQMFWHRPLSEWKNMEIPGGLLRRPEPRSRVVPPPLNEDREGRERDSDPDRNEDESLKLIEAQRSYSDRELLRHKDFGELSEAEITEIEKAIHHLVWQLGRRRTRRLVRSSKGRADLRRSVRRALRHGGELLEWAHRKRSVKPRPLTVIADVSGSMERYSRLLLHFVYTLTQGMGTRVESFVFSTRLTRLSPYLKHRRAQDALSDASAAVSDWSGGTRIGDSLRMFNLAWGRRVLSGGAVVLLISDGWDRGEPDLLSAEMARLRRTCSRVIWLNPLLGSPEYEPLTRGMVAALPHVDDFLPVHNLESLELLATHLAELDSRQVPRRRRMKPAVRSA